MAIDVELFTRDHVIRGFVETSGERLSDVLNVVNETSIVLTDVQIARLSSVGKIPPIVQSTVCVEKEAVLFAMPVERDLTHKSLYRRASRMETQIALILPAFEIQGTIHITERLDIRRVLTTRPEIFVPLTDATVVYILNPQLTLRSNIIAFNKALVSLIGHIPTPTTPRPNAIPGQAQ